MKNLEEDSNISEYYARKDRRHPLWKSESEYKAIFNPILNDNLYRTIENEIDELCKYLNYVNNSPELNESALDAIEDDINQLMGLISIIEGQSKQYYLDQLEIKKKHLEWLSCFKNFADSQQLDFDFLIIQSNQFNSGFGKLAFEEIEILFPELSHPCVFKDVTNVLTATKSRSEKYHYLFVRRNTEKSEIDVTILAKSLMELAAKEAF